MDAVKTYKVVSKTTGATFYCGFALTANQAGVMTCWGRVEDRCVVCEQTGNVVYNIHELAEEEDKHGSDHNR